MQKKPLLICVVGPTAIGKTSLAISLAKAFEAEIISADSRQFYKEMEIGTAVPSQEELKAARHHFIQNKSIFESFTVGDFEKEALQKLDTIFLNNSVAIMVGGSGLYVDAVVKGLDNFPKISEEIRNQLNKTVKKEGIEKLQEELKVVDPTYYNTIDINNPRRLIRALEIFRGSGKPYSSFLNVKKPERNFNTLFIGLSADREIMYSRINKRVDLMVEAGLFNEAKKLYSNKDLNALQTVGYKELFLVMDATIELDKAIEEIKKNTRRFAKRQITWFKKNDQIKWYDFNESHQDIIASIKKTL